MKTISIFIFSIFFLLGCATPQKETVTVVKTVTENIYIEVPQDFLVPCDASMPPNQQMYLQLTPSEKEYELTMYSTSLLISIAQCNLRIDKLKEWNSRQREVFISKPVK
jgi:hypothetical protein